MRRTWGRGGGWQGPYISGGGNGVGGSAGGGAAGEFWEDLNVYVVSQWVAARLKTAGVTAAAGSETAPEEEVFRRYCTEVLGLNATLATAQQEDQPGACDVLRSIALQSADAVLQMHYCKEYDTQLQPAAGGAFPTRFKPPIISRHATPRHAMSCVGIEGLQRHHCATS